MPMREYTDEKLRKLVLDSKKYFQLFMVLSQTPDYPRNLARNAGVSIATMGEMLSNMLRLYLMKRVKKEKGRQQYYEIDWKGFYQIQKEEWKKSNTTLRTFMLKKTEGDKK
jgi:DNA-binding transcriptional regulator GbsR (MarR family)